jgi:hypothetical protein
VLDHEVTLLLLFSPTLGYGLARKRWLKQLEAIRSLPEPQQA